MPDPLQDAIVLHAVVDADRRVVESTAPLLKVGALLTPFSWLGAAALSAVDGAERTGQAQRTEGRDFARATHWLVDAVVVGKTPWRARITLIDATLVVSADRQAVHAKLVHAMRNVSFAVLSVLEALEGNRPEGADLDRYLDHLRQPAESLARTMARFEACMSPVVPSMDPLSVRALVEGALLRIDPACRPAQVSLPEADVFLRGDAELLSETIASMLESGGQRAAPFLDADQVDVGGRSHVRIVVTRTASAAEQRAVAGLWDLAGGVGLDVPLRLAFGRAVVLAHGGDVLSDLVAGGTVRLGLRLPTVSVDG